MTIYEFKENLNKIVLESIPGIDTVSTRVFNYGEEFRTETNLIYSDCLLEDKNPLIAEVSIILDKDLCYRVVSYSIFPSFETRERKMYLEDFLDIFEKSINDERSQILFKTLNNQ